MCKHFIFYALLPSLLITAIISADVQEEEDDDEEFYDEDSPPHFYDDLDAVQAYVHARKKSFGSSSSYKVLELNSGNFDKTIQDGVTLVMFYAPWCHYCENMFPKLEELAKIAPSGVRIAQIDCEASENKEICEKQSIDAFPTLLTFKNGLMHNSYKGDRSVSEMKEYIKKFV